MKNIDHETDLCVVGGGLAGMCVAISAARHGSKVVLMHERPVLGGNASGEIRMWVMGAQGKNKRETGIIEEIQLENNYRNPLAIWSIWDSVLYEKVRFEPNITLLMNCSCNDIVMEGQKIVSVKGWQLTTQTWHTVKAKFFADCSGDSILAPLSGADFRIGREAREEFGESIAPEVSDLRTMGMSCLLTVREYDSPQKFIPPKWAYKYLSDDDLPKREHDISANNLWWIELGGEEDSIHDTEKLRDELLKILFGIWDHIKNQGDHGADNYVMEYVQFLPGKRESRRYLGGHIVTQNDVDSGGHFEDIVAYGGWPMDDHHPAGFRHKGEPTTFHAAPSPFGIPYCALYSRNIENLFFAGRNISLTHAALSSARVMATCALLGQAAGTAAAIAVKNNLSPRGVYEKKLEELQQTLMDDDCYIPWKKREIPEISRNAVLTASSGNPEPLRNGIERPVDNEDNCYTTEPKGWVEYSFGKTVKINRTRIVFDSNLNRAIRESWNDRVLCDTDPAGTIIDEMRCFYPLNLEPLKTPSTLVKSFRIEAKNSQGVWETIYEDKNNYQRLVKIPLDVEADAIRLVPVETWGSDKVKIFAFDVR